MSWVSENKFLTGFGAVMLAGLGTLGYFTYAAMDKSDTASAAFDSANAQLKKLRETKPSLTDAHLKELLAQKQEMTDKVSAFQAELKSRVLPVEPIKKEEFQNKLKETVAQISAKAAAANVERPKDFYLGFGEYQSIPPNDKAAPVLARELRAIELVMNVLIKVGGIELDEFHRDPLPEEGRPRTDDAQGGSGRRKNATDRNDRGMIERNGLRIKLTSSDDALRKVLTELANHKQQLFVIRNVAVQNKVTESPQRVGVAPTPSTPTPDAPATPPATPPALAPVTPPPAAPAPAVNEGSLAYVFGTEKITSIIDIEVLNIEESKPNAEKPEKGSKKKEK